MIDSRPTEPPDFELPDQCPGCDGRNHDPESGNDVCPEFAPFCCEGCQHKYHTGNFATVKVDGGARYVGDGHDGGYCQAARGPDGWYVSTIIDSDTGHFVDDSITDEGPFPTKADAIAVGRDDLMNWCFENRVDYDGF